MRAEWAELRFDRSGQLVNPLTGDVEPSLALIDGEHRRPGARYRVTVPAVPAGEDGEQDEPEEHQLVVVLRTDDDHVLEATVSDDSDRWTMHLTVEHGRLPRVGLGGEVDLTALLRMSGTPGCLAGYLGGTGSGVAALDLRSLETAGPALDAEGRASRFRGAVTAVLDPSPTRWRVDVDAHLAGRGIARPVMWFAGRRLRREFDRAATEFWATADARTAELSDELARLRTAIEREGGPSPFVRRALWDEDFDPGLSSPGGGDEDL